MLWDVQCVLGVLSATNEGCRVGVSPKGALLSLG